MWTKQSIDNVVFWSTHRRDIYEPLPKDLNKIAETLSMPDAEESVSIEYDRFYRKRVQGTHKTVPAGVYEFAKVNYAWGLLEKPTTIRESYVELDVAKQVYEDFIAFKNSKHIYTNSKNKMPYRRGVLLYGPPGTGKTFITHKILEDLKSEEVIVIFSKTALGLTTSKALNQDPRLKIIIFEEFTNVLKPTWDLDEEFLNFLDGESSLNNTFIIATTNYPERLPENIASRPGRFDRFYKIDYLSKEDKIKYLNALGCEPTEAILDAEDLTVAHLKELYLSSLLDNTTLDEALDKTLRHKELVKRDFQNKKSIGFE